MQPNEIPSTTPPVPLCAYKGKTCPNPRLVLADGTQLQLCEYHRKRANYNHRGWLERRRQERENSPNNASTSDVDNAVPTPGTDDWLALAEQMRREDEEKANEAHWDPNYYTPQPLSK